MKLLNEVDKPGSDVDEYVQNLEQILNDKANLINQLKDKLKCFKDHLQQEEALSKKFYEQRAQILDVFDMNNEIAHNEDDLLQDLPTIQQNWSCWHELWITRVSLFIFVFLGWLRWSQIEKDKERERERET